MFQWLRRGTKPQGRSAHGEPPQTALRDALFGDTSLEDLVENLSTTDREALPWSYFTAALAKMSAHDVPAAQEQFQKVLAMPGAESRVVLLAWNALRACGVRPSPDVAGEVHGVVIEMGLEKGPDIVAAYADHCARYWNQGGGGIVWNAQDAPDINAVIDSLLETGRTIVAATGLWDQPRLGPPPKGSARVSVLTPGGLHFGQGPQEALWADPLSKPALDRAQALMVALIQYAKR